MGDELRPEEITRLLGYEPSKAQRKGDVFRSATSGKERVARIGMWSLEAADRQPSDPDAQVGEILSKLSADMEVWRSIMGCHRADVFFGLFMREWNEGLSLSPATLLALGSRGIEIGFDIYGPFPEEPNKAPEPTPGPVMPRAEPRVTPAPSVAHL